MPPARRSRAKYNYSEETLNTRIQCQRCGKTYKPQGIKSHEVNCKRRRDAAKESERANKEYLRDLRRARAARKKAASNFADSGVGPSRRAEPAVNPHLVHTAGSLPVNEPVFVGDSQQLPDDAFRLPN
ncbi:hypothetical protein PAXINDRAFT_180027 [Paxillus involutus ATCC 200175]|nr:hypothetical protein PAXINDRAFT_180027 [Paxillus involutus ATCC 200175]